MVRYQKALKDFVQKHKVSEFVLIDPSLCNATCNSMKIHLKFDIDAMKCRLGEIRELKYAVARILEVMPSTLVIHDIKEGCILLILLIPTSVAEVLFNNETSFLAEQVQQFQKISLVWLQCGQWMFDFKQEISSEGMK